MYTFLPFETRLCQFLRYFFNVEADICLNNYTIWSFSPKLMWNDLKKILYKNIPCPVPWFPLVFWCGFIISSLGVVHSWKKFQSVYCCPEACLTGWRKRSYYVLSLKWLRRLRIIGTAFMTITWSLLTFGVFNTIPEYMEPWMLTALIMFILEFIIWLAEVLTGGRRNICNVLFTFMFPIGTFCFVKCIKSGLENAIAANELKSVSIWRKFY